MTVSVLINEAKKGFGNSKTAVGSAAPDFFLIDTDGESRQLSQFWSDQPVVLVFLRHFGCTFCREQIALLRQDYAQFTEARAEVVCIAQGPPHVGKAFRILNQISFPVLLCGDDTSVYEDYGLGRGSLWQLFGLPVVLRGIQAVRHGIGRLVGDGFQMPGTFIVDTTGTIRYVHRAKNAADHASNAELLSVVRSIVAPQSGL